MQFTKHRAQIYNKETWYWQAGPDKKPAVILLHGFSGTHEGMAPMADSLKGWRLIIPDLPGCGLSQPLKGKHTLENYSLWLDDFLQALGLGEVIVVGYSFGARLALAFSSSRPHKVKKLVLITPAVRAETFIARLSLLAFTITEILPLHLQKKWLFNRLFKGVSNKIIFKSSGKKRRQKLIAMDALAVKSLDIRANIEMFDEFYRSESLINGEKIHVPTLIIAGDKDEVATVKSVTELQARFSNAELKIMKSSGHILVLERPSATGNIIHNWLK